MAIPGYGYTCAEGSARLAAASGVRSSPASSRHSLVRVRVRVRVRLTLT